MQFRLFRLALEWWCAFFKSFSQCFLSRRSWNCWRAFTEAPFEFYLLHQNRRFFLLRLRRSYLPCYHNRRWKLDFYSLLLRLFLDLSDIHKHVWCCSDVSSKQPFYFLQYLLPSRPICKFHATFYEISLPKNAAWDTCHYLRSFRFRLLNSSLYSARNGLLYDVRSQQNL